MPRLRPGKSAPSFRHPPASRVFAAQTWGQSGAEGDLFRQDAGRDRVRDRFALPRASPDPIFDRPEDDEAFRVSASLRPE